MGGYKQHIPIKMKVTTWKEDGETSLMLVVVVREEARCVATCSSGGKGWGGD